MSRIDPIDRADLPECEEAFELAEAAMGFVPNSLFTMARVPGLLDGILALSRAIFDTDLLDPTLRSMIASMASAGAGCRYCQAHTAASAAHLGVDEQKLAQMWSFETSDHFDDRERSALRLAFHSGQLPNAVTDADIEACRRHFTDDQIAAIVAVCSLFGYLNRWNDTMATTLEEPPSTVAGRVLQPQGWEVGRHAHGPGEV